MNLYGFVHNDPLAWIDPWGLQLTNAELLAEEGCGINNSFTDPETGRTLTGAGVLREIPKEAAKQGIMLGITRGAGKLWGGAKKLGGGIKGLFARKAPQALTPAETAAINKINNILTKNFKPGPKGDISGAIHDMVGNPIPKPGGGTYDHVQDLGNILRGLRNNADALKNATDPAGVAACQQAQQAIQQIEAAIVGIGL